MTTHTSSINADQEPPVVGVVEEQWEPESSTRAPLCSSPWWSYQLLRGLSSLRLLASAGGACGCQAGFIRYDGGFVSGSNFFKELRNDSHQKQPVLEEGESVQVDFPSKGRSIFIWDLLQCIFLFYLLGFGAQKKRGKVVSRTVAKLGNPIIWRP